MMDGDLPKIDWSQLKAICNPTPARPEAVTQISALSVTEAVRFAQRMDARAALRADPMQIAWMCEAEGAHTILRILGLEKAR